MGIGTGTIAYKLVNHQFQSIITKGRYCKTYPIGEVVTAKSFTLGLMCFDSLTDLLLFKSPIRTHYRILEVVLLDGPFLQSPIHVSGWALPEALDLFYYDPGFVQSIVTAPDGTICCGSLRVVKEVTSVCRK